MAFNSSVTYYKEEKLYFPPYNLPNKKFHFSWTALAMKLVLSDISKFCYI